MPRLTERTLPRRGSGSELHSYMQLTLRGGSRGLFGMPAFLRAARASLLGLCPHTLAGSKHAHCGDALHATWQLSASAATGTKPTWQLLTCAATATRPGTAAHARHVVKMHGTASCQRVRPGRARARLYARIMIQAQNSSAATWMATRMKMTVPRLGTSVLPGRCAGCTAAAPAASASAPTCGRACAHGQPRQSYGRKDAWWAAAEERA